ncbi:hypothetical protein CGMCC3_g17651 [Colletotrichum fructicola]|nr:uncharacterized protein CGMCC3_g17651 [Colletotrichum fructicola]KAE9566181.1 hypothetical protein CGMCC3_g17651 [Colletotrichum fructicola]
MRWLNGLNVAVWVCSLLLFLFYVTPGWDTTQHCSLLNVTTANLVKNVSDVFDVFDKDQSQRRLTIPDDISDPLKSIATKAGAHVATVVASADKAISTGAVGLMDGLNGWRDAVPVYVCLQTRGVWQLGYPNDTTKLVPYGELNMSQTFHIKALENLWQAARLVVPGLPEIEALDMDSADLGALSGLGIAPYWLLSFVLVGTCTAIVLSIFLPQGLLLLCIPRIVTVALLFVVFPYPRPPLEHIACVLYMSETHRASGPHQAATACPPSNSSTTVHQLEAQGITSDFTPSWPRTVSYYTRSECRTEWFIAR